MDECVGVVVPMYNAAATIDATLDSILAQTHRYLDIIVVDDGSSDGSPELVERRTRQDSRLRLVRQANSGVARARNAGAALVQGAYLAFVDADDLWAKDKIALQLTALRNAGEEVGIAYCWAALIDGSSFVIDLNHKPLEAGNVLSALCDNNFVGNGSSLLVKRAVFDSFGGFDAGLRDAKAQGCEDFLFCLDAAERTHFCVVPRPLVGYRVTNENMSSDVMQMWRSARIVTMRYRNRHPKYAKNLDGSLVRITHYLIYRALQARRFGDARRLRACLKEVNPAVAITFAFVHYQIYLKALLVPRGFKRAVRSITAIRYEAGQW